MCVTDRCSRFYYAHLLNWTIRTSLKTSLCALRSVNELRRADSAESSSRFQCEYEIDYEIDIQVTNNERREFDKATWLIDTA